MLLGRLELGLGGGDVAIQLHHRLLVGVFFQHVELGLGRPHVLVRLLHGEFVRLQLDVGHVPLLSQPLAVAVVLRGPAAVLLGHEDVAVGGLHVSDELALDVLFPGDSRRLVGRLRLDLQCLAAGPLDLLLHEIAFQRRLVELDELLAFFHIRALGNDP